MDSVFSAMEGAIEASGELEEYRGGRDGFEGDWSDTTNDFLVKLTGQDIRGVRRDLAVTDEDKLVAYKSFINFLNQIIGLKNEDGIIKDIEHEVPYYKKLLAFITAITSPPVQVRGHTRRRVEAIREQISENSDFRYVLMMAWRAIIYYNTLLQLRNRR